MNSSQKSAAIIRLLFAFLVLSIALALLFKAAPHPAAQAGQLSQSQAADAERSLDISRYPNEPLELVDLMVGQNSVKSGIKTKFRVRGTQLGLDNVKFKERNDWFKNVKIKLRNISGTTIYDIGAALYFKPSSAQVLFRIPLVPAQPKHLKQQPVQPGEEIDLQVDNERSDAMIQQMIRYGVEPNELEVTVSVDSVYFSDSFSWDKGTFMRRNSNAPNKWDRVDKPTPSPEISPDLTEASRLFQPAGFKLLTFKSIPNIPQSVTHCTNPDDYDGTRCADDVRLDCYTWYQHGTGYAGYYSQYPVMTWCGLRHDTADCNNLTRSAKKCDWIRAARRRRRHQLRRHRRPSQPVTGTSPLAFIPVNVVVGTAIVAIIVQVRLRRPHQAAPST